MNYTCFKFLPVFEKRNIWWNLLLRPPPAHPLPWLIPSPVHSDFTAALASLEHSSACLQCLLRVPCEGRAAGKVVLLSQEPCSPHMLFHLPRASIFFIWGTISQACSLGRRGWEEGPGFCEQLGPITSHCRSWGDVVDRVMHRACPS